MVHQKLSNLLILTHLLKELMLMGLPSHMAVLVANTFGLMLLDVIFGQVQQRVLVILAMVSILLLLLVVTTTVRLVTMMSLVVIIIFSLMIHYGMDSNVLVWRLPAVLTPTCRGSTRHLVRPPLKTLN